MSQRVHAWHVRHLAGLPAAGRSLAIELQVRRLVCSSIGCPQRTFRQQLPDLAARYARRTARSSATVGRMAVTLAGRAGAAVLAGLGMTLSRSTVLRVLMALPIPQAGTPRVLSVDDVALRRGRRYAMVVVDAVTHRRVDVLPDRKGATLTAWLREHPGAEIVCRNGSAVYAEAIRQGAPDAVQVSDRWHLWHGLGAAVEKTVIAHSSTWRTQPSGRVRPIDARTRSRHAAVHELLGQGVGLLECGRRLGWSLNTVKRYARVATAEQLARPPRYGKVVRQHRADLRAPAPAPNTDTHDDTMAHDDTMTAPMTNRAAPGPTQREARTRERFAAIRDLIAAAVAGG